MQFFFNAIVNNLKHVHMWNRKKSFLANIIEVSLSLLKIHSEYR